MFAGFGGVSNNMIGGHTRIRGGGEKKRHVIRLSVLLNIVLICVIVLAVVPYLNSLLWGQSSDQGWVLIPSGKSTAETEETCST